MAGICEIVEAKEGFSTESRMKEKVREDCVSKQGRVYSIEDDINRLLDSVNIKTSVKAQATRKNPMKRPIRDNSSKTSGIGMSESVNLKQALRGLCISQASEMAAMKKRSLKLAGSSGKLDVGTTTQLHKAVVFRTSGSSLSTNEGKRNLLAISFPGKIMANLSEKIPESVEASTSFAGALVTKTKVVRAPSKDKIVPLPPESTSAKSSAELLQQRNLHLTQSLHGIRTIKNVLEVDDSVVRRKYRTDSDSASSISHAAKGIASKVSLKHESKKNGEVSATSNTECVNSEVSSKVKVNGRSKSREKGEFSQSSKSSMGEYSSSTSEESSASGSTRCCNRPHMSKDMRWESVHSVQKQFGFLNLRHFKLLRRLGSGDIGTVYLAELVGTNCLFALKVMDNEFLARRKKLVRAQTEREILQMLDHPFLPTLYAHFTTDKLSGLVMEYCPGGDLHVIRQKQPSRCFSEQAARFYVAEVLLALEYLHMLGIVYRDLKPENILVREDGHIMLSDFDLSLRSVVNPTLLRSSSPIPEPAKKMSSSSGLCSESSCIDPFCLQPSWQVSCFTPRLLTSTSRTGKLKSDPAAQVTPMPQLVAEPTDARSNSFVGTHEYLAPEIVKGEGHGSAVDWWTYGIFLYELLYGKTPFKGSSNEVTLANVVSQPLRFPETPLVSFHAKDLIRGLLVKQPENRLGFVKGAAEIKQHPFFEGLNWALIRCAVPPERPRFLDVGQGPSSSKKDNDKSMGPGSSDHIEFELF